VCSDREVHGILWGITACLRVSCWYILVTINRQESCGRAVAIGECRDCLIDLRGKGCERSETGQGRFTQLIERKG
jgi:hypothetical protein